MSGSEYVEKKSASVLNQTHSSLQPQRSYHPEPIEQETSSIEDQLERASKFGYNGLGVPVNAPATPPPPVQRQSDSGGSENNSQPQEIPEASATSETVEETVSREELPEEETPPNQESPDTEGEVESVPETVQAESGEEQPQKPFLQAQLERASQFGYNGLDVPVNTPSTPSPRVQRKLTLDGLDNEYQPEVIERANPVLNGLNQFKVQRLSEEQGEVSLLEQQPEAGAIQRKCSECEAELADKEDKHPVQAKLELGQPEDKYEQEADAVARTVVEKINAPQPQQPVQRQSDTGGASELNITVMRHSSGGTGGGSDVTVDVEQGIQQARGGGQGLDESVREPMEQAFGADFSGVRVHTDAQSDQLNRSIQAKAFTTGQDIFFKQGEYQPGSRGGQELLAHELTHVVQQTGLVQRQISPACRQTNRYPGNLEHEKIEQDYQQNVNSNSATEFSIPGSGPNGGIGYADIVDLSTHAIYEIKTFLGSPLGVIEANRYRQFAEQKCDPNVEWQLGTQYPYRVIPLDAQRELVAQQYPQFPGVITYYTRQQQKQPQPDPVRFPVPVPVPQQEQQPVIDRRTALQQIADFVEQVIQSGENAERAALRFLTEHPKIKYFLIGAAIIILVATLIQDLLTLGAGIADDPASFSIVWTLVRVAQTIP